MPPSDLLRARMYDVYSQLPIGTSGRGLYGDGKKKKKKSAWNKYLSSYMKKHPSLSFTTAVHKASRAYQGGDFDEYGSAMSGGRTVRDFLQGLGQSGGARKRKSGGVSEYELQKLLMKPEEEQFLELLDEDDAALRAKARKTDYIKKILQGKKIKDVLLRRDIDYKRKKPKLDRAREAKMRKIAEKHAESIEKGLEKKRKKVMMDELLASVGSKAYSHVPRETALQKALARKEEDDELELYRYFEPEYLPKDIEQYVEGKSGIPRVRRVSLAAKGLFDEYDDEGGALIGGRRKKAPSMSTVRKVVTFLRSRLKKKKVGRKGGRSLGDDLLDLY